MRPIEFQTTSCNINTFRYLSNSKTRQLCLSNYIILSILLAICSFYPLFAENNNVKITSVFVNSESISMSDYDKIVLSSQDTIYFRYDIDFQTETPFLFSLSMIQGGDTATRTAGLKEVSYSSLKDGDYVFELSAFDLRGVWKTNLTKIAFKVDNTEAALHKKIKELATKNAVSDSVLSKLQAKINTTHTENTWGKFIFYGISIIAILFITLFITFYIKNKSLRKHTNKINNSPLELKKLQSEKDQELEKLKYKVDAINKRVENISELSQSIDHEISQVQDKGAELTDLRKQKNDIFADVLKGISNPTNSIKSLVELLRNYDFTAKDMEDIVANVVDATSKIIDNIDSIQHLSELSNNDLSLNMEVTDVRQLVDTALKKDISTARQKNIDIKINIDKQVNRIHLDPQKITIVLHNLINNAIKFTGKGGIVTLNCFQKEDDLIFEISDTGVGIGQDDLKKMYTNFASKNNDFNFTNSGGSIGLFTVKKYIEAHKGRITVSSIINSGTKFSFNIPIS